MSFFSIFPSNLQLTPHVPTPTYCQSIKSISAISSYEGNLNFPLEPFLLPSLFGFLNYDMIILNFRDTINF